MTTLRLCVKNMVGNFDKQPPLELSNNNNAQVMNSKVPCTNQLSQLFHIITYHQLHRRHCHCYRLHHHTSISSHLKTTATITSTFCCSDCYCKILHSVCKRVFRSLVPSSWYFFSALFDSLKMINGTS